MIKNNLMLLKYPLHRQICQLRPSRKSVNRKMGGNVSLYFKKKLNALLGGLTCHVSHANTKNVDLATLMTFGVQNILIEIFFKDNRLVVLELGDFKFRNKVFDTFILSHFWLVKCAMIRSKSFAKPLKV